VCSAVKIAKTTTATAAAGKEGMYWYRWKEYSAISPLGAVPLEAIVSWLTEGNRLN
jgi:hypothetical protein